MKIIGLSGGTGSGKSVIAGIMREKGAFTIDADKIARDITLKDKPAYNEIIEAFGRDILDEKGDIIRPKLGDVVFRDKDKLRLLNELTHKHVMEEMLRLIFYAKEEGRPFVIIDVPLLTRAVRELCDEIWVVFADEKVRLSRIMKRDSITYEQAKSRILAQKSFEDYKRFAHKIIDNSNDIDYVKRQVEELL